MEKLIRGIHKFQSDVYTARAAMFRDLVGGQNPQALFITCSDSRIVPDLICQADPGDLFVMRNAGNLVPPFVPGTTSGEAATIEYAIRGLGVKNIIVCGHTRCGAMQAALSPDGPGADMPQVRQWLAHADASAEIVVTQYQHLTPDARWRVMAQENVLVQVENLRTHSAVADALRQGAVKLHAWVYKLETGQVFAFDPEVGQYVPLVHTDGTAEVTPMNHRDGGRRRPHMLAAAAAI